MEALLEVKDLVKDYEVPNAEEKTVHVLKGLNFSVKENEFVGIMGKSGCGKTTLLKLLGLIHLPTGGSMTFKDKNINRLWEDECADIRRKEIGFIFQDFYLMDSLTVEENIMIPMILERLKEEECYKTARQYAEHFQILHLIKKYPYELSGGERQRAAICRALVNHPDLILADEPTGNLDSASGRIVVQALENIHEEMGKTIIMVTHDPQIASHCERILFLKDGQILSDIKREGEREEFYKKILGNMEMNSGRP